VELQPSVHPMESFRGTARGCGRAYGQSQAEAIHAFMNMEVTPDARRLRYASRCWKAMKGWNAPLLEFIRGVADGSGRSIEETTLLLLHEEVYHTKHCTGLGATREGTRDGRAIIGQNWDWGPPLYPWSSLLRLRTDSMPRTITYAYPGLWACAGVNEHGMALVWTGSGYAPKVKPKVGIPTYALIHGILAGRNCGEALALLKRSPIAGCFIFFIADRTGEVWVIEGFPGRVVAVQCVDVIGRANHYECDKAVRWSKQETTDRPNTCARGMRMMELLQKHRGNIDGRIAAAILGDHGRKPGLTICQHPIAGKSGLTIDSFYAVPHKGEFWIARGTPCRHEFVRYEV